MVATGKVSHFGECRGIGKYWPKGLQQRFNVNPLRSVDVWADAGVLYDIRRHGCHGYSIIRHGRKLTFRRVVTKIQLHVKARVFQG